MNALKLIEELRNLEDSQVEIVDNRVATFISSNNCCDYIFDNVTAYVTILDKTLLMQNGLSYKMNDYSLPSNDMFVSSEGGCDELFVALQNLSESEIETMNEDEINEFAEENEIIIESKDVLMNLYLAFIDACYLIEKNAFVNDNVDDYDIDENRYATNKNNYE